MITVLSVSENELFAFRHVEGALNEFSPQLVVYNAGTDILDGDPLGNLSISAQVRDFVVKAFSQNVDL